MKRWFGTLTAALAAMALLCQGAEARDRRHKVDPRIRAVGVGVGAASTVGFLALNDWHWNRNSPNSSGFTTFGAYAAATAGCVVLSPMIATAVVRRPLTFREAHVLVAGCIVPFIGPLLVNAAYDANPHWEPRPPRRKRR
jgi:hypothetical protein